MESNLYYRLKELAGKWPVPLSRDFWGYLGDLDRRNHLPEDLKNKDSEQPYWVLLPAWLSSAYSRRLKVSLGWSGFLSEVFWAQYCLFLFLRIQDDLFDGDTDRVSLIFVADQLLLEADRVLSEYFHRKSEFWSIYRVHILRATRSLVESDWLQQMSDTQPRHLLKSYAGVCSVLQIAFIAVCLQAKRSDDLPRVTAFADAMAIAGQIIDDLQDLKEDLNRGRLNFAAIELLGSQRKQLRKQTLRKLIARAIFVRRGTTRILSEIHTQIELAERALAPLRIKEANDYLKKYKKSIDQIEDVIHRQRVEYYFGG